MAPMADPVAWTTTLPGQFGPIHVAVSAHGVVAVAWLTTMTDVQAGVTARLHGTVVPIEADPDGPQTDRMAQAVDAVRAVLAGEPHEPIDVDLRDRPDWDRRVLAEVGRIPLGTTAGYGEVARRIGSPGAARAVGGAVGRNPITLLIPCHRVIAGDGTLGGYGGDGWGGRDERLAIKRDLLLREGVTVPETPQ